MSAFDDFVQDVLDGAKALAIGVLAGYATQIQEDAMDFIRETKDKLIRWTDLLAQGKIDDDDFAFLVQSQEDLAKMRLITEAGIGAARIKRLRDDLISLVIRAAIGRFLPVGP